MVGQSDFRQLEPLLTEEEDTIMDIYEPYLMQLGFIERTSKGRTATSLAYKHFKNFDNQKRLI